MKSLILAIALASFSVTAQPTIHVADDIIFTATYRVGEIGNWDGFGGYLINYGTSLDISPSFGDTSLRWTVMDFPANVFAGDSTGLPTNASVATWQWVTDFYSDPLPIGYPAPDAQWVTNYFADVRNGTFDPPSIPTGITPFQSGDVWIDWNADGSLRVSNSAIEPTEFGKWLSDGSLNPNYIGPPVSSKKHGKAHFKQ